MRSVVTVVGYLMLGSISLALADQSTTPEAGATPSASATPATPATAATPAAAPQAASAAPQAAATTPAATSAAAPTAVDMDEKRLIAAGYKMHMKNGEKVFCRREEELGTRLGAHMTCGTAAQLKATEIETREQLEKAQRLQSSPSGR